MTSHPTSLLAPPQTQDSSAATALLPDHGQTKVDRMLKDSIRGSCDLDLELHPEDVHALKTLPEDVHIRTELGALPFMDSLPAFKLGMNRGEEFVCGWGAAFINITATFPLNKVMFRQQLLGIPGYKALAQLRKEGLRNLYRGLLPPLLLKTTTMSVMFGSYNHFRTRLDASFPDAPSRVYNHALAAMMAGTLEATLTPFERIQTLLQDRTYQQRFHNTLHAARELRAYGVSEYYRGGAAILLRNGPSNVFFFLGKELVNERFPALQRGSSHLAKDFVCGACLGAVISTAFFPLNVLKTRVQSQLGGPSMGLGGAFRELWQERDRRVSKLFRGVHVNYMRSFISWGIINASYEYLMRLFRQFRVRQS